MEALRSLPQRLLAWYDAGHRDLPWRRTKDPYAIWLSEIMLQQTRVEAVRGYYVRFLEALPTVAHLAACDDELLHKLWEGLGYYSRVRNLKKAARVIMETYGGTFPREHSQVLALPGIGPYTAGAICSIAFGQKTPAVDGNVLRVMARVREDFTPIDLPALGKQVQTELAEIYPDRAGDFTQALMELGATVCGPNRRPDCDRCPCAGMCLAFQHGTAEQLPVKSPKKEKRQEEKTVLILRCEGRYALEKRPPKGLLAGLWQFPNVPGHLELPQVMDLVQERGLAPREVRRQLERRHIFTHIVWNMRGFYLEVGKQIPEYTWMTPDQIENQAALPTALRQFWEERQDV